VIENLLGFLDPSLPTATKRKENYENNEKRSLIASLPPSPKRALDLSESLLRERALSHRRSALLSLPLKVLLVGTILATKYFDFPSIQSIATNLYNFHCNTQRQTIACQHRSVYLCFSLNYLIFFYFKVFFFITIGIVQFYPFLFWVPY
jgi:hypothetical protein